MSPEVKKVIDEIKKEIEDNETKNFLCTQSNGKEYNFYKFANLDLFGNKVYSGQISIQDTLEKQNEIDELVISLKSIIHQIIIK